MCPTALFFGIPCPGCGLTRATLALLRGDVGAALHFHPLVFVLTPLAAYALGTTLLDYVRGGTAGRTGALANWFGDARPLRRGVRAARRRARRLGRRFAGYFGGPVPVESLRGGRAVARPR